MNDQTGKTTNEESVPPNEWRRPPGLFAGFKREFVPLHSPGGTGTILDALMQRPDLPIPWLNPNAFTSNFFEYLWLAVFNQLSGWHS